MGQDLLEKLRDQSVSLSETEMTACLDLFRRDAEDGQAHITDFFVFHYYCTRHPNIARAHEEQNIRQKYIYRISRQRNTDAALLNALYIHSAEYFYSIHVFSECIRCLFSVLENKSVAPQTLSVATSILISVLAESGLYEQCYPYAERLKKVLAENPASPQIMFLQEMSFMQLYGFAGDSEKAEAYYQKLKSTPLPEGFGPVEEAYLELLHLSIRAVQGQGTPPTRAYTDQLLSTCRALNAEGAFQDSNYSVTLLPVLRYIRPAVDDAQLLALYECFEKFVYSTFDLLGLYSYLFEEAGLEPSAAPELHKKYLGLLRLYYMKDRNNHRQLIENALFAQTMEAEYRRKAVTDRLTGLGNRLAYTELFQHHVTAPGAPEPGLCLVMMDLDDLKKQNDRFGHAAGDQLLRGAAGAMRSAFPKGTELFRYGGDEFIAMLMAKKDAVEEMIRRLDAACLAWTNSRENLHGATLSVSAGYAFVYEITAEDNAEHLREVCELADQRMYEVKKSRQAAREQE